MRGLDITLIPMRALNMINSRKQLIAQIHQIELDLHQQREQALRHQNQLSQNIVPILSLILGISALFFLCKSRNNLRKVVYVLIDAGQIVLLAYFKKQIAHFFEKN